MNEGHRALRLAVEIVLCLMIAIVLVGVVQQMFLAPVGVVGSSMYPTINAEGDRVFVQKRLYSIDRGDVVVFYRPNSSDVTSENPAGSITLADFFNSLPFINKFPHVKEENTAADADYTCVIKRVVGLPGDTVTIRADATEPTLAHLYVNGALVKESVIMHNKDVCGFGVDADPLSATWTVAEGELFVLGDNRDHSYDSEDYGPIKSEWLMGKVVVARIGGKYKFDLSISMD
ncbi:MAG: signal peptidase I [Clostridia bacterium]|nr:signal peptidase I [Clostridia bacterium]